MIFRARFVVPVDGPPVENGELVVEDGRIAAVGRHGQATPARQAADVSDFGDAVILPGLVNAHTHLELSDLAGRVPPTADFTTWLKSLFAILSNSTRDESVITSAVRTGVRQSISAGVTTLGDITRYPAWSRSVLAAAPLRVVSFGEVAAIGRRRHLLAERLNAACAKPPSSQGPLRIGVSPHAPYTVEPAALHECLRAAKGANLPVCMHVAEVADEEAFTRQLSGPLAEYLRELGLWDVEIQAHGCRPVDMLDHYPFPSNRTLLAHVNHASDADIATLARHGASVAYCPRTHAAFGHPPHRFREMRAAGVNVCLGTDSLASNPSLSILDELRFLHAKFPDLPGSTLLEMATMNGAQAMGLIAISGTLTVGKSADFVVVPLQNAGPHSQWMDIFQSDVEPHCSFFEGVERRTNTAGSDLGL